MRKYSFLIITDHNTHTKKESIFPVASEIIKDQRTSKVFICSRGDRRNVDFYYNGINSDVYAFQAPDNYSYSNQDKLLEKSIKINPEEFDVFFVRLDPPIHQEFLSWLGNTYYSKTIINEPLTGWETTSKEFLTNYPDIVPGVKLVKTIDEIKSELEKYPVVLKPLKRYGGNGLIKLTKEKGYYENNEIDFQEAILLIKNILEEENLLLMKYLKNVKNGDKRILIANGQILGALIRIPKDNSWLCNTDKGGELHISSVTKRELEICKIVNQELLRKGQFIYGIDTLEDDNGERVLSEINTVNAGGLFEIAEHDPNLYKVVVMCLYDYILDRIAEEKATF